MEASITMLAATVFMLRMRRHVADDPGVWMLSRKALFVRVAWRAGWRQRYGARSNWICQKRPPVNVVPLLGKAAANDLLYDRWLYLLRCCCCRCWQVTETMQEVAWKWLLETGLRFLFLFHISRLKAGPEADSVLIVWNR